MKVYQSLLPAALICCSSHGRRSVTTSYSFQTFHLESCTRYINAFFWYWMWGALAGASGHADLANIKCVDRLRDCNQLAISSRLVAIRLLAPLHIGTAEGFSRFWLHKNSHQDERGMRFGFRHIKLFTKKESRGLSFSMTYLPYG